jgi:hypothetical protein
LRRAASSEKTARGLVRERMPRRIVIQNDILFSSVHFD